METQRKVLGNISVNKRQVHTKNSKHITNKPELCLSKPLIVHNKKRQIYHDSEDDLTESESDLCIKKQKLSNESWHKLDTIEDDDITMVAEYSSDVFKHLYEIENNLIPKLNYITTKNSKYHIRSSMRSILINWLIEVHEKFHYVQETLLLTLNIMDRFLSTNEVTLSKLQLLAVTSLFIASKFEEINLPKLSSFAYITDGAASMEDISTAEFFILKSLNFEISSPNALNFLRRISKADLYDFDNRNIAKYLLEHAYCSHYFINYKPSYVSAMAMYIAKQITQGKRRTNWNKTFVHYSGGIDAENDNQFQTDCQKLIHDIAYPSDNLDSLYDKYSNVKHSSVYPGVKEWCLEQETKKK